MLEVEYYKDYRHNYLILKDNGRLSENIYQRKMITENKIKGLLSSCERYINGEILLYCEITSKQSFLSIYEGKSIGIEELRRFFVQLKLVNDMLQKYLLDCSSLILRPEFIFQNIETGEYSFLYYPDPEEGGFSELLDFLMSRVNNEDMEAVEMVYKMADLVSREQFVLDEVLNWFQEDTAGGGRNQNADSGMYEEDNKSIRQQVREESDNEIAIDSCENQGWVQKEDDKKKKLKTAGKIAFVWIAGMLAAGVLLSIKSIYQLSYQEEYYIAAGWGMILVAVLGLTAGILCLNRAGSREFEKHSQGGNEMHRYMDACVDEMPVPVQDAGNTVFVPWTENCENKLYSMDRKNKHHIDLEKLPFTVGKLAGAVDMVINEQSISRMHARFSRVGKNVCITDLNSTNGTFRNGMRLTPNASEVIEPGDEIRLGKLKFIYR